MSGQFLTLKIVFHLIFQFIIVFSSGWYCIFCQRPLSSCYECAPDRETRFLRIQEIMMRHKGAAVSNFKRPKIKVLGKYDTQLIHIYVVS